MPGSALAAGRNLSCSYPIVVTTPKFIVEPGGASLNVVFVAYCVDFEKENPAWGERFGVTVVPESFRDIARAISAYSAIRPQQDLTAPSQVALWLHRGVGQAVIMERFPFTGEDYRHAQAMLKQQ